jgi:hypothetical protein
MCENIAANFFFFALNKFNIGEHAVLFVPGGQFGCKREDT